MRYVLAILALSVMIGCSENEGAAEPAINEMFAEEPMREDLYDDTLQLSTILYVSALTDAPLTTDESRLFDKYEDKYLDSDITAEYYLADEMLRTRDYYEAFLADESQLSSEGDIEEQYYESVSNLIELTNLVNDIHGFRTAED